MQEYIALGLLSIDLPALTFHSVGKSIVWLHNEGISCLLLQKLGGFLPEGLQILTVLIGCNEMQRSKDLWSGTLVCYTCSKDLQNGTLLDNGKSRSAWATTATGSCLVDSVRTNSNTMEFAVSRYGFCLCLGRNLFWNAQTLHWHTLKINSRPLCFFADFQMLMIQELCRTNFNNICVRALTLSCPGFFIALLTG